MGALIAADMPLQDLQKLMREVDYGKFQDESFLDHLGKVGKGMSLLFEKGIYEGDYLRTWLDGYLKDLGKQRFRDLRLPPDSNSSLPPERQYRLVVMASDVTRGRLVRLPWDYPEYGLDPDEQLVADAVRCSMSIPFFYEPVKLRAQDDQGKDTDCFMVDGGMLSNFPVDVFDRTDGQPPRWPTFGIKLSARPDSMLEAKFQIHGTFDLAKAMVGTLTSFHDQMHIEDPCVLARTMFVDTLHVKATDFDIKEETQDMLYKNGRSGAKDFLAKWNFKTYLEECRTK